MEQTFTLPVVHNGHDYEFDGALINTGFSYKIRMDILGVMVAYEPDEERNFRAIIENIEDAHAANLDKTLVQAVAEELIGIFKE